MQNLSAYMQYGQRADSGEGGAEVVQFPFAAGVGRKNKVAVGGGRRRGWGRGHAAVVQPVRAVGKIKAAERGGDALFVLISP